MQIKSRVLHVNITKMKKEPIRQVYIWILFNKIVLTLVMLVG